LTRPASLFHFHTPPPPPSWALTAPCGPSCSVGAEPARALSVGEELVAETMPLRHGRRVYRIDDGPRPSAWCEVKISYPASV
jgi:hypothetical protein